MCIFQNKINLGRVKYRRHAVAYRIRFAWMKEPATPIHYRKSTTVLKIFRSYIHACVLGLIGGQKLRPIYAIYLTSDYGQLL